MFFCVFFGIKSSPASGASKSVNVDRISASRKLYYTGFVICHFFIISIICVATPRFFQDGDVYLPFLLIIGI